MPITSDIRYIANISADISDIFVHSGENIDHIFKFFHFVQGIWDCIFVLSIVVLLLYFMR